MAHSLTLQKTSELERYPESGLRSLALSANGELLAVGYDDGSIHLWALRELHLLGIVEHVARYAHVHGLAFHPSSTLLASASEDGKVILWDVAARRPVSLLANAPESDDDREGYERWDGFRPYSLAFSPDGNLLACGALFQGWIKIWQVATGIIVRHLREHKDHVASLTFRPDGSILASGSYDNTIRLWDVETGESRLILSPRTKNVKSIAFNPDGALLASCGLGLPRLARGKREAAGALHIWDIAGLPEIRQVASQSLSGTSVVFSPDGALLACGTQGTITLWDAATDWSQLVEVPACFQRFPTLFFLPDGRHLISGGLDHDGLGCIEVWRLSSKK